MNYEIIRLTDRPELKEEAAEWFHEKWGIPLAAYQESMEECLEGKNPVPQWYAAMENGKIIGGLGVIENELPSMSGTGGNISVWYRETASLICQECIFTEDESCFCLR